MTISIEANLKKENNSFSVEKSTSVNQSLASNRLFSQSMVMGQYESGFKRHMANSIKFIAIANDNDSILSSDIKNEIKKALEELNEGVKLIN